MIVCGISFQPMLHHSAATAAAQPLVDCGFYRFVSQPISPSAQPVGFRPFGKVGTITCRVETLETFKIQQNCIERA